MAGEIFDPHALLMKLRNPHTIGREGGDLDRRAPPPFLDPHQSRPNAEERPDVIHEMEVEISELTTEVTKLRAANKLLKSENKSLEGQLVDQKDKYDDIIAKLRNHIVSLNKQLNAMKSPGKSSSSKSERSTLKKGRGAAGLNSKRKSNNQEYDNLTHKSFSGPTFSEMMRRNTQDSHGFKDTLRKENISDTTQHRNNSSRFSLSHEEYPPPLPPPSFSSGYEDERHHHSQSQSSPGLLRTQSLSSQNGERKGMNSSLQRAFSFGTEEVGKGRDEDHEEDEREDEENEDDDDNDIPVVDIDLRY